MFAKYFSKSYEIDINQSHFTGAENTAQEGEATLHSDKASK